MATAAQIKAEIDTRVRAQKSESVTDGIAEILDQIVDNIEAGNVLTEERLIDLNGQQLSFRQDGVAFLQLNPTPDNESVSIVAVNRTGATNSGSASGTATDIEGQAMLLASFNGASKMAMVICKANATLATIQAVGLMEFANNAAAITGGLEAGMLYYTVSGGEKIIKMV